MTDRMEKLLHRTKKLEDLVSFLMTKSNADNSMLNNVVSYMNVLKTDFGLSLANRDIFKKLVLQIGLLKSYYSSSKQLNQLNNKLTAFTFNLDQNTDYLSLANLYNANVVGKSIYVEFLLINKLTNLFTLDRRIVEIISIHEVNNKPGYYTFYTNGKLLSNALLFSDNKFRDIIDDSIEYKYIPILLEFDINTRNLYYYQVIVNPTEIQYNRILLFDSLQTKSFTLLRDAICYVGLPNIVPDAYKVNAEGAYRQRVEVAIDILESRERNLPFADYSGISGLQGYSYIKELATHLIQARVYNYEQTSQFTLDKMTGLQCRIKLNENTIRESNIVFDGYDLIVAGIHDLNNRIYDPSSKQTVCFIPISRESKFKIAYDEIPTIASYLKFTGQDYFDLPITVSKTDVDSKEVSTVNGFIRFTQEVMNVTLNTINSVSQGNIRKLSYLSCAALDHSKSDKNDDGTYTLTYDGYQYGLGFGDIQGRHMDSALLQGSSDVVITGKVFIDASHAISLDPTEGEFTYEFNGKTTTVQSIFEMYKDDQSQIVKTYLASVETFSFQTSRTVGIQVVSNDSDSSQNLILTKANKKGALDFPFDTPYDSVIYTLKDDPLKVERKDARDLFNTTSMIPLIPNFTCVELVDNMLFGNRNVPNQPIIDPRANANEFGWNGMMKSKVNTWSRFGYIDKRKIQMQCQLSFDGWNKIQGKFADITQQQRHDQNFDTMQFKVSSYDDNNHVIYIHNLDNWDYQPDLALDFKLLELTIKGIKEVTSDSINNIFDTNVDLTQIQNEIELIFRTQKDIINKIADIEYKVGQVVDLVNKIIDVLDNIIKSMQQASGHSGGSIIQDLFNVGMFVLEMFAPELVLFFAPFALLLVGIFSLTSGDIEAGIIDLIGAGIIAGYYHVPLYIIPYGKRLINKFTNFNDLTHEFLNYTTRIGNSIRKYLPSLRGFYDVRRNQLRLRREQYTYTLDTYTQRYELVELDLWPGSSNDTLLTEEKKKVKFMRFKIDRVFRVTNPKDLKKLNTIRVTVLIDLGTKASSNSILTTKGYKNNFYNGLVEISLNIEYRQKLDTTGEFKYIQLNKDNYKDYIYTDMEYQFLYDSVNIAILYDSKLTITNLSTDINDFMDGILEIAVDDGKIDGNNQVAGLIHPHIYYNNSKLTSDILWSALGTYGDRYTFKGR